MSSSTVLERTIVSVMANEARGNDPEQAIDLILATTGGMRPEPRWLALLKEPPMRTSSRVAAGSPNLRLVVILAIIALLLLALVGAIGIGASLLRADVTSVPSPYGIAANGSLAYEVAGDIYAADATGNNAQAIIAGPEQEGAPQFSHDGTKLSFMRQDADQTNRLMVAHSDGTGVIELTLFDAAPSTGFNASPLTGVEWSEWAPADDRLAVFHYSPLGAFISIVSADGQGRAQTLDLRCRPPTTCRPGLTKVEPSGWFAWRSTGGELIFTGHPSTGSLDLGLYAIRPDNTRLREIGAVAVNEAGWTSFQDPQLTPDGSAIWYWNWEPNSAGILGGYLHARDLATGQDRRVQLDPESEREITPRFSPDGKSVLFRSRSPGRLIVAPVDGSQPGVPIGPSFSYLDPRGFDGPSVLDSYRGGFDFSPDGTKVVLTLDSTGRTVIIDVATGDSVETVQLMHSPTWQRRAP